MPAYESGFSVLTIFRSNCIYLTIPVTRGDMLEDAKNPDNAVMGLLCLAVSLLGGQLKFIFQILCALKPFQSMLVLVRFVHSCT